MPSTDPTRRFKPRRCPRVLLVGRDRKYLAEASERLRAHGFQVATTCRPSEIADLVKRLDLNVAVVDGSHYLGATIRGLTAIEVIPTPLAVVTVAEDSLISPLSRPHVLPKWRSLARLIEHVELAFELRPIRWEADVAVA
jgi:hypothetical protein